MRRRRRARSHSSSSAAGAAGAAAAGVAAGVSGTPKDGVQDAAFACASDCGRGQGVVAARPLHPAAAQRALALPGEGHFKAKIASGVAQRARARTLRRRALRSVS